MKENLICLIIGVAIGAMAMLSLASFRLIWIGVKLESLYESKIEVSEKYKDKCEQELMGYATDLAVCNYTKERIEKN